MAAFDLLNAEGGPVLTDFPETIEDASAEPLACPLPPRSDDSLPEAVDEAKGLRAAYDRSRAKTGNTMVGRAVDADGVPDAVAGFVRVAEGTHWKEAGLPGHPLQSSKDIMSYYEEAAMALADHIPEARSAESWFFQKTAAGKVLKDARLKMREQEAPFWFYITPFTQ